MLREQTGRAIHNAISFISDNLLLLTVCLFIICMPLHICRLCVYIHTHTYVHIQN